MIPKQFHNIEIRQQIFSQLSEDCYEDLVFAVISDFLFFLPINMIDILPTHLGQFNPAKQVCRDGVFYHQNGINITWKNDNGLVTRTLSIMRGNGWYDTVVMMEKMFMMQPTVYFNQPLFTRVHQRKSVPVLRSWFTNKYKKYVQDIGLNPTKHTWRGDPNDTTLYISNPFTCQFHGPITMANNYYCNRC